MNHSVYHRRNFLRATATATAAFGAGSLLSRRSQAQTNNSERRFLFVIGAAGGGSIIDSLMPMLTGPASYTEAQIEQPSGSNLRAPIILDNSILDTVALGDNFPIATFLSKHAADTATFTQTVSSVNHNVGAKRAVLGNGVNGGRSLQEVFSMRWGQGLAIPTVGMAADTYNGVGDDTSVPAWARVQSISDPQSFAFTTHGYLGLLNAPSASAISRARAVRSRLEAQSSFIKRFGQSRQVMRYQSLRAQALQDIETQSLISKLLMTATTPSGQPVSNFGLEPSPEVQLLQSKLPNFEISPFEAQAALAYLMAKSGLSSAITISPVPSPTFVEGEEARALNSPIAFDWSHVDHRSGQNAMWSRMFQVTDALVDLLKATEYGNGKSMWDQSFIYMPTEFGRDKVSSGGSGHHLNNGVVCISPMIKGNRVYGGVDANTALTYGFDPTTGEPTPQTHMTEADIYSMICHACDIDFPGRRDFPAVI
ncbi:MAG: twin-arginine translocation signal domain-containing protein [Myxococcales bacterium]|nr:twin-arginine translocation signal domain-containing protein [Myxococcales bacterium]